MHTKKRYNNWTVLYVLPDNKCIAVCDCGRLFVRNHFTIRSGASKHCCCCKKAFDCKDFATSKRIRRLFYTIKTRCYNKNRANYKYYGGKGVKICDEWLDNPSKFVDWSVNNGYKAGLTIDRIDSNGDYCPSNCRFVDMHIQNCNQAIRKDNKTGHKGIRKTKAGYIAYIRVNRRLIHIGSYKNIQEAITARKNFIIKNNLFEYEMRPCKER